MVRFQQIHEKVMDELLSLFFRANLFIRLRSHLEQFRSGFPVPGHAMFADLSEPIYPCEKFWFRVILKDRLK